MIRFLTTALVILFAHSTQAQQFTYKESGVRAISPPVKVSPSQIPQRWNASLHNLEAPSPGGSNYQSFLLRQKEQARPSRKGTTTHLGGTNKTTADLPVLGRNFNGNAVGGAPNDNDMAISNDGKLISVINSNISIYDVVGDSLMFTIGLNDFSSSLGLTAGMYDPRAAYDPIEDKFIMVWLSGNRDSTSNIVLAFSETADPLGDWNLYFIPGNMLDGQTWTDYPMIAITQNEFILTGNALINDTIGGNDSWKFLFKESLIWQIDKQAAFAGDSLRFKFYSNIRYNNAPIRNLCPIQGGSTLMGPEFYLVSNRNFDIENDTFFVLKVTGEYDDPNTALEVNITITDQPYGVPPDAKQPTGRFLQTNDCRVLDGYIEEGIIHFVGNTILPDSARSGIYHGQIVTWDGSYACTGTIIGQHSLEYGYPAISYTGKYKYDDEAVISFSYVSEDSFPGVSAVFYNGFNGDYSDRLLIKEGEAHIQRSVSPNQRWGDYSGNQRKYDEPGKVWITGYYGIFVNNVQFNNRNLNATWVAELTSPDTLSFSGIAASKPTPSQISTYPNPSTDMVYVQFESPEDKWVEIALYNLSGQLVKTFIRDDAKPGTNQFSFSVAPLAAGTYLLNITGNQGIIATQKVVVSPK
jgi:hypothetical protein